MKYKNGKYVVKCSVCGCDVMYLSRCCAISHDKNNDTCTDCIKPTKESKSKDKAKDIYYKRVWELTENSFKENKSRLENGDKRGFKQYHIDHIIPIAYGYKNNIPAETIAHIDNLRMLYHKENMIKGAKITKEVIYHIELLKLD